MKYSTCCDSPFAEPGYPENDICNSCGEHASAYEDDPDQCEHPKDARTYQPAEPENNVIEGSHCEHCLTELPVIEPDFDSEIKERMYTNGKV